MEQFAVKVKRAKIYQSYRTLYSLGTKEILSITKKRRDYEHFKGGRYAGLNVVAFKY